MSSKFFVKDVPYVKSGINLCQFEGFSCFGCCGYDFKSKDKAVEAIHKQTLAFEKFDTRKMSAKFNKVEFRERHKFHDLNAANFCRNLVLKQRMTLEQIKKAKTIPALCPLHPALNQGSDLRAGHCDTDYMCKMQMEFHKMSKPKKQEFIDWLKKRIKRKDIDWYSYSVNMDTNVFWESWKKKK